MKFTSVKNGQKENVISTLVLQNVDASALTTRCFAPESINYVCLTKSVQVVNIHTKQKITKFKLRQNGLISTGKAALNTNKRPGEQ